MPTASMKAISTSTWRRALVSSITLPPSLMTVTLSRKRRIQPIASMSVSAFWIASCNAALSQTAGETLRETTHLTQFRGGGQRAEGTGRGLTIVARAKRKPPERGIAFAI